MDIRALLFDVFGTVVDWRTGVAREAEIFRTRHGLAFDPLAFADAWRARYQPAMEDVRTGRRPFVALDVLHRENLPAALRDVGIESRTISEPDLDDLNLAWHRLDPWPDAVSGLARMKRNFIIAPLSNGNLRLLLDMAKRAGLPWDAILGAEVVQAYKPMPEAYLRTARMLGLEPAMVCLVAAHNSDLAAARACGFRTAFVLRGEHGPNQSSDLTPEADWDYIARDFIDLADQLSAG